jgi:hypothetical protein
METGGRGGGGCVDGLICIGRARLNSLNLAAAGFCAGRVRIRTLLFSITVPIGCLSRRGFAPARSGGGVDGPVIGGGAPAPTAAWLAAS